uniref:Uncharacterized protein MANES_03G059000 n=1 Tax=Rhizophora mucronata TaxID=61149 RepID=A0A2P2L488_RHIMU
MWGTQPQSSNKQKQEKGGLAESFRPENFIPGVVIGFIFGLLLDLSNPSRNYSKKKNLLARNPQKQYSVSNNGDQVLKMVCLCPCFLYLIRFPSLNDWINFLMFWHVKCICCC